MKIYYATCLASGPTPSYYSIPFATRAAAVEWITTYVTTLCISDRGADYAPNLRLAIVEAELT